MDSSTTESIPIPIYQIDLSLPPHLRYITVARDFAPKMQTLTYLFEEILESITPNKFLRRTIETLAGIFLFRVFSKEETQELKGIAKASGVRMFLLVALNVLLDSMLGCTSGGVVVAPKKGKGEVVSGDGDGGRMMHFRTLDWAMDGLREVLVVLEFVRSKSEEPEKVIARTVTYAGFVGVLTGLRENLSLSLNFRPNHECSTRSLRIHQLMVLFGLRPSISSILRNLIIPSPAEPAAQAPALSKVVSDLETTKAAPCYLILSDGDNTAVLEKDLNHARTRIANDFIVQTNCDSSAPTTSEPEHKIKSMIWVMENIVEAGDERHHYLQKKYDGVKKRQQKKWREEVKEENATKELRVQVREETLKGWVKSDPIWYEGTHFGCIMDPKQGTIRWIERGTLMFEDVHD